MVRARALATLRPVPHTLFSMAENQAMAELARLRDRARQAEERVDEVGRQARAVGAELVEAREALVVLEGRAGAGKVTVAERKKAEERLAQAEAPHAEPWSERRRGAERGAADAHAEVGRHAAAHLAEIVAEIEEDGRAAAGMVDAAAERFIDAVERRAEVERALTAAVALTRPMRPGDVTWPRSDQAAAEVRALLERGGEAAPVLRVELPVEANA
jgi:hypothetical protein